MIEYIILDQDAIFEEKSKFINGVYGERVRNVFEKFEKDSKGHVFATYDDNFERSKVVESDLELLSNDEFNFSEVDPLFKQALETLISKVKEIIEILPTGFSSPMGPFQASFTRFSYTKFFSKANSKNQALHADFAPVGRHKYL